MNGFNRLRRFQHLVAGKHSVQFFDRVLQLLLLQNVDFIRQRWVTQPDAQKEPVQLSFGQGECTFVFDWILR